MNRKMFDQTLGQAIGCAIIFALVAAGMTVLPRGSLVWESINVVLWIFLVLLNVVMIIGFTSFQNKNTKIFYACVIPVYPLYLLSEELIRRWEWWHYVLIIVSCGVCIFVIAFCLENRIVKRSVESVVMVISLFSSPYLYSAIF